MPRGPRSIAGPAPSSSPSVPLPSRSQQEKGLAPGVVLRLGVPSAPGVTPGGGRVGCPRFGFPRTLPGVAVPPPRLPQGPGVPVRGTVLASAAARATAWGAGRNPGLWDHPIASSPAPGVSGQRFPLPKHPKTPTSAWGELGHPLASLPTSFGCSLPSSPVAFPGLGEGVSVLQRRSRGRAGGAPGAVPPSQKSRDCLWSVEPHRRVCTLQILQQNIF